MAHLAFSMCLLNPMLPFRKMGPPHLSMHWNVHVPCRNKRNQQFWSVHSRIRTCSCHNSSSTSSSRIIAMWTLVASVDTTVCSFKSLCLLEVLSRTSTKVAHSSSFLSTTQIVRCKIHWMVYTCKPRYFYQYRPNVFESIEGTNHFSSKVSLGAAITKKMIVNDSMRSKFWLASKVREHCFMTPRMLR